MLAEAYRDKTILLTGGTGFLGTALVEKILRSLPDLGRLYLVVRPSKDKSAADRFHKDVLGSAAFRRLREELGERARDDALVGPAADARERDRERRVRGERARLALRLDLGELRHGLGDRHVSRGLVDLPASGEEGGVRQMSVCQYGRLRKRRARGGRTGRGSLRSAL